MKLFEELDAQVYDPDLFIYHPGTVEGDVGIQCPNCKKPVPVGWWHTDPLCRNDYVCEGR